MYRFWRSVEAPVRERTRVREQLLSEVQYRHRLLLRRGEHLPVPQLCGAGGLSLRVRVEDQVRLSREAAARHLQWQLLGLRWILVLFLELVPNLLYNYMECFFSPLFVYRYVTWQLFGFRYLFIPLDYLFHSVLYNFNSRLLLSFCNLQTLIFYIVCLIYTSSGNCSASGAYQIINPNLIL